MILIDTCVLLWMASDSRKISRPARTALKGANAVFVSTISAIEIGLKASRRSLTLPKSIDVWFPEILEERALQEIAISGEIAAAATMLPPIHNDPFDRIIIATAKLKALTVITPDPEIHKYPGITWLW